MEQGMEESGQHKLGLVCAMSARGFVATAADVVRGR
jgi:hypothetical protein